MSRASRSSSPCSRAPRARTPGRRVERHSAKAGSRGTVKPRIRFWIPAFAGMAAAAACLSLVPTALAQGESTGGYPIRPIKVIVPFTPGSVTDILARTLSDRLAAGVGQPVVVENRPGAGGTIGTGVVAKSAPDGYTLAVVSAGFAVTPAIYDKLPYDPTK